jgi:nitroreductase
MTAAAIIGVDTCPLEGISPNDYDEILGLKGSGYATAVACALGYRSMDDKYADAKKARFPSADLISHI